MVGKSKPSRFDKMRVVCISSNRAQSSHHITSNLKTNKKRDQNEINEKFRKNFLYHKCISERTTDGKN